MTLFSFSLFGITIAPNWYGFAYAMGFLIGYTILKIRGRFSEKELDSLFFYAFIGVILGGRLGYVLFYNLNYFIAHPLEILATWNGGMSFHGGCLGVIIASLLFARKYRLSFFRITDELSIVLPFGLFLGRLANYGNNELYGFSPYSGPYAMMVDGVAHFPSPLLEAGLEGIILGCIIWSIALLDRPKSSSPSKKEHASENKLYRPKRSTYSAVFLIGYGILRIIAEQFRMPDAHIGYILPHISLGIILSVPMILLGLYLLLRKPPAHAPGIFS